LRLLHLHSGFDAGGKELRAVRLMSLFGPAVSHAIVSAQPGAMGAASRVDPALSVDYPADFPPLAGRPGPARLQAIARAMQGFDLVLTYNWGAMDAVMAHTLFAQAMGLPPLVHHEDGFNEDEAQGLKRGRNWYRRLALGRAARLVVPSERLEDIALGPWAQPRGRVVRIANGIDTAAYAARPRPDAIPRVIKRKGEKWLGTLAGLRAVKNLPRLIGAFSHLPEEWNLVILGEGPEREGLVRLAMELNIGHRVHLPGFVAAPAAAVGLFDLFALSSDSEQFPLSVVEAMAAGLAVVAPAVGDIARMVAPENAPFITMPGRDDLLTDALLALAADPALATRIGAANRQRARTEYDEAAMLAAYRATYGAALGRASFP
jgi:glycosyltransferase involved in cell wall biosynthesis